MLTILHEKEFQIPGYINESEFWTLLEERDANAAFARLGVDVETFAEIGEFLFDEAEVQDPVAAAVSRVLLRGGLSSCTECYWLASEWANCAASAHFSHHF